MKTPETEVFINREEAYNHYKRKYYRDRGCLGTFSYGDNISHISVIINQLGHGKKIWENDLHTTISSLEMINLTFLHELCHWGVKTIPQAVPEDDLLHTEKGMMKQIELTREILE